MATIELRDPDDARDYLMHGLWLQRVAPVNGATLVAALDWLREIAAEGDPVPVAGFVADAGHLVFEAEHARAERVRIAGLDGTLRAYEDYVLGKLYADHTFERAADAVQHYRDRDRARGLRFLVGRMVERADAPAVLLNPAIVKALQQEDPVAVLEASWERLAEEGPLPLVVEHLEGSIAAVRNLGSALAPEDVFELEHGTALAEFGQRLALRQVFRAAAALEETLPHRPSGIKRRRHEVATRMLDEDSYPIGGFTSISNRGTIESLLHSQLAYMEGDEAERPDLFDIKFLRDELLYYSRDENAFLRRRRTFVFALHDDLASARVKDPGLRWQRIVLVLAVVLVAIRRTTEWLGDDALTFEILFVGDPEILDDERELLEMMLREQVKNGTVEIGDITAVALRGHCDNHARTSTCHAIDVSIRDREPEYEAALATRLVVSRPAAQWALENEPLETTDGDPVTSWSAALVTMLDDFATA